MAIDHKVIFYDQRACGQSSLDVDTASMSISGFIEDIELLRIGLNLQDISILGHSWGGLLAMNYAIKYPQHLEKIILSNPMPASTEMWQKEERELSLRISAQDSLESTMIRTSQDMKDGKASAIKELMLLSFNTQFYNKNLLDSLNLFIPDDFMERSAKFSYLGKDLSYFNFYDDLEKINTPTLIIYGDYEPASTLSGRKLAQTIHGSKLEIIKKSGHFPFVEQPDIYFKSIKRFLKE